MNASLPLWWKDYLAEVQCLFQSESPDEEVQRALAEMTSAAEAAIAQHRSFLRCLGLRQPNESESFESWAKEAGYDTSFKPPRYEHQRTRDAERGWMARAHRDLLNTPTGAAE